MEHSLSLPPAQKKTTSDSYRLREGGRSGGGALILVEPNKIIKQ